MAFQETKGNKTVEACVQAAPGGMFKGYVRITVKRGTQILRHVVGRDAGRPVKTEAEAMGLAEEAAKRELAR
ncbi:MULTISPECIES: hypothetical protein [Paraburkholderia]|uniref:AP2 domain-containing protein n=1 Tax=Paraburkholderia tuberum TaxID=157910 RepID=A0A1H1FRM5_9BURK|nr:MULTISPECIES: hypothetical protein [Paraburkholderia]MBC8736254.1 hypothetical protein [Paraburkholderia sp. UCT31]SDR03652.1 hypothetical protein SAMN05445850_2541 [Paraburkholderia tuberum]